MGLIDIILGKAHEGVGLSVVYIVGPPGTGKSTLANALIYEIIARVGRESVHYVRTRAVKDVFTHININRYYNVFFVDDAQKEQGARRSMSKENVDLFATLPDVRHIAEGRGMKQGRIIVFAAAHVPRGVDLIVRNFAKITMFKQVHLGEEEHRRLMNTYGIPTWEIKEWINKVLMEDPEALSRVLVLLPSGDWGWLIFTPKPMVQPDEDLLYYIDETLGEKREEKLPEELEEGITDLNEIIKKELEKMKRSKKWKLKAMILERTLEGETNLGLAEKLKIPESTIRHYKVQAMGELKRRVGLIYENIVAEKLKEMGYENVERHGGESEPDITCEKDGEKMAVSVKLYDYGRARHSLRKEEFKPEIDWAKENNGKAYIYYTNLAWHETYFFEIPEHGDLVTIKRGKGRV